MTVLDPAADGKRPPFRITGLHVLIGMILFFGIIIALDTFFVTLAYRSFSGEVASNPYEAGLAFNRKLADERRQASMGWTISIAQGPDGAVTMTVKDREHQPLSGLKIVATLERPATEKGRRIAAFKDLGGGRYQSSNPGLSGAWDLRANLSDPAGMTFDAERRLIWP